jgi:hypothetical protein
MTKNKMGRNPFTSKPEKPRVSEKTPPLPRGTGKSKKAQVASAAHVELSWRVERFAFFRFENTLGTAPSLSLLSLALRLPHWKSSKNRYEFNLLKTPISLKLLSIQIQQQ